jgi:ribonuclease Z
MRPSFHPRLINGPFHDPGLLIPITFQKQALLFDLGDLGAVAPGDLVKIEHVFVSHTHMDHFIGFDHLLRTLLGRGKTLHIYGPKGILDNVASKLRAYTWNLVQNYAEALMLHVNEIQQEQRISQTFDCRTGFRPSDPRRNTCHDGIAYQCAALMVETAILDHQIPCLAFSLQEQFHVNILKPQLESMGLTVGPWVTAFKHLLFHNADPATEVKATVAHPAPAERSYSLGELRGRIAHITRGQKITYVADALYSPANEEKIITLARKADHLFIEAAFLETESDIARHKYHLTARQAGMLARKAEVQQMTLFPHSPRSFGQAHLLEEEARQAFEAR